MAPSSSVVANAVAAVTGQGVFARIVQERFMSPQTVLCLLDSGADINRPNVSGATPLYFACR